MTLAWDPQGRLTGVASSAGSSSSATYTYDPLDRLETIASSGVTTSFLYVGLTDAVAQVTTGSALTKHVTDLEGAGLYEFDATALAPLYLGRDGHGDVTWSASATGAVSSTAAYDPYGNLTSSSGSVPNTRWQGSWQDSVTGLYYVVARWYSPLSGRFLSNDPLTQDQTNPQGRNPYAYGAGNPVNRIDVDGRSACAPGNPGEGIGCMPPPVTRYFLNTGFVGRVREPRGWYFICGAGAMRIVLAFAGADTSKRGYGLTSIGRTFDARKWPIKWQKDDSIGTDYMMYLASKVVTYTTKHGVSSDAPNVVSLLNRESGVASSQGFSVVKGKDRNRARFYADIESEVSVNHVPAMVAVQMDMIPSQAMHPHNGGMHWIAVVGFDVPTSYFYYIDTCWGFNNCGYAAHGGPSRLNARYDVDQAISSDPFLATPKNGGLGWRDFDGGMSLAYRAQWPGTWRISMNDLWSAMTRQSSGCYIRDYGASAVSSVGR